MNRLLIALLLLPLPVFAAPTLTIGTVSGTPGSSVTVPITISSPGTTSCAIEYVLTYSTALTYQSVTQGSAAVAADKDVFASNEGPGTVKISIFGVNNNTFSSGTVANVAFAIASSASGTIPINGTCAISDCVGNAVSTSCASGAVTLTSSCPVPAGITLSYSGSKGCNLTTPCEVGESVKFTAKRGTDSLLSCDDADWDFGDGTTSSSKSPTKKYTGTGLFPVTVTVSNTSGSALASDSITVVPAAGSKPTPVLTFTSFPTSAGKGQAVTFAVSSDLAATGWKWTFGDGSTDSSQGGVTQQTSTMSHTYTKTGPFTVKVTARNPADTSTAPTGTVTKQITITTLPETRYLIPVAAHVNGGGALWRTDLHLYNPDTSVSAANPLVLRVTFAGKEYQLGITRSTQIYEDFLWTLLRAQGCPNEVCAGPIIITTSSSKPPYLWTRTYNQTGSGTYGQLIPAVRLDQSGRPNAVVDGRYHITGLRSDGRYRTNLGFINPTSTPIVVGVKVYDQNHLRLAEFSRTLQPLVLDQFPVTAFVPNLNGLFSVQAEVPSGQWVLTYASLIDGLTNDPVYLEGTRDSALAAADNRTILLPGVSHTGQWRSDTTVFNPDEETVQFDLQYYDMTGSLVATASNLTIPPFTFLHWPDVIKQGILGYPPDGAGVLRLSVGAQHAKYPLVQTRTYFDGAMGTYGQGIMGVATSRPNVTPAKAAVIPGARSDAWYYTNIGLVNLSGSDATATVRVLHPDTGATARTQTYTLKPNQMVISRVDFGGLQSGTLKVEANGSFWAFASVIDQQTRDPEYVPAVPLL